MDEIGVSLVNVTFTGSPSSVIILGSVTVAPSPARLSKSSARFVGAVVGRLASSLATSESTSSSGSLPMLNISRRSEANFAPPSIFPSESRPSIIPSMSLKFCSVAAASSVLPLLYISKSFVDSGFTSKPALFISTRLVIDISGFLRDCWSMPFIICLLTGYSFLMRAVTSSSFLGENGRPEASRALYTTFSRVVPVCIVFNIICPSSLSTTLNLAPSPMESSELLSYLAVIV